MRAGTAAEGATVTVPGPPVIIGAVAGVEGNTYSKGAVAGIALGVVAGALVLAVRHSAERNSYPLIPLHTSTLVTWALRTLMPPSQVAAAFIINKVQRSRQRRYVVHTYTRTYTCGRGACAMQASTVSTRLIQASCHVFCVPRRWTVYIPEELS